MVRGMHMNMLKQLFFNKIPIRTNRERLKVILGGDIGHDGLLYKDGQNRMVTECFYRGRPESFLQLLNMDYSFQVATYSLTRDKRYMYTYDYQKEENWSMFNQDYRFEGTFQQERYTFTQECYFRVIIKSKQDKQLNVDDVNKIEEIIEFESAEATYEITSQNQNRRICFESGIQNAVNQIYQHTTGKSIVFCLLTDSHYTVNGTWQDTAENIRRVQEQAGFDAIVHLGDLTDGMLSKQICQDYASQVISDLRSNQVPLYLCIGNHDTNYFHGNPDCLSYEEQYALYLRQNEQHVVREKNQLYYYVDYPKVKVRCLFLYAFDHREYIRYGFSMEEVNWVKETLQLTPEGYSVVVFSHDAPLARLDYWASEIRNGEELMEVLEAYHNQEGNCILGYIHGHTHADYVYTERAFPIISLGCSKIEYFPDKKPEGAVRQERTPDTVTQELWDTLIITPDKKKLDFIRFGAGENRSVKSVYGEKLERERTKVWAHRGASGYAPENTLPAFQKAIEMGADGIELDVQLTRDQQVVVIHDETIDRVSDGSGKVADYKLEQLRQFNYNKTHPEYEHADIPTLEEVLELIKPTKLIINIELKTGVNFYEGIERKTLELVKQYEMEDRIIYSSFNHYSVMKIKELCPTAKTGLLDMDGIYHIAEYAKNMGVNALHPWICNTQYQNFVKEAKEHGLKVHVWTVNTEDDMRRMIDMGVDAMITNYPDVALKIVSE